MGKVLINEPERVPPEVSLLKPDLFIANQECVFGVDVTVHYKSEDSVLGARIKKIRKYTDLLPPQLKTDSLKTISLMALRSSIGW